jgi:hypothetical protein
LLADSRNRVRRVVLGLSQEGACTNLCEIFREISLKRDLSNDTTVNPPLFSLVNTFKEKKIFGATLHYSSPNQYKDEDGVGHTDTVIHQAQGKLPLSFLHRKPHDPTLQRKSDLCTLRKETARPQSQFPLSCFSQSDLFIPTIGPPIFMQQNRQTDRGNMYICICIQIAHRNMNVGIGTEAAQFHFWEHLLQIFGILSLLCITCTKLSCNAAQNRVLKSKGMGFCKKFENSTDWLRNLID